MATQANRVLKALTSGQQLTRAQIASRFGVANPTAVICNLRKDGHKIYLNEKVTSRGVVRKYSANA